MTMLKAQSMYKTSQLNAAAKNVLLPLNTNPEELHKRLNALPLEQLEMLNNDICELARSRDTDICEVLAPYLVPEVKQLQNDIEKYKQNIKTCEEQLSAVHSAVSVAFAETYYKEVQYDYSSFYKFLDARVQELTTQRERDEMARQLQAAQRAAPQAALEDAAMSG